MVALINEIQIILFISRIFKFNTIMYYPFIIILQQRKKKKKKKKVMDIYLQNIKKKNYYIYLICKK
jgi:cellobiose-specific phosphotransferase system component IIC